MVPKKPFLLLLLLIRTTSPQATLTTVAGGNTGFSGGTFYGNDQGVGTQAMFNVPTALSMDPAGCIYIADSLNNAIRFFNVAGNRNVTTIAGGGSDGSTSGFLNAVGSNALFYEPTSVACDGTDFAGTNAGFKYGLYVADRRNHRVRYVAPNTRAVTTLAGSSAGFANGLGTSALLQEPTGVALDTVSNPVRLYVADFINNAIRAVGTVSPYAVTTLAGGGPGAAGWLDGTGTSAKFFSPHGIAVLPSGLILLVADMRNNMVRAINISSEEVSTLAGGNTAGGNLVDDVGTNAAFNNPQGVAVDRFGYVLVADTFNNAIRVINPNLSTSTLAGSSGTQGNSDGTAGELWEPKGVVADVDGGAYVADSMCV
jgi:hypothetical protein